jgi:3-hydroxybutyryl-CoA dehydratase
MSSEEPKVGARSEWSRTFTAEDVRRFAELSGDRGAHHVTPDAEGRLLVHGLLTATLPTKLGGDMNFLARELNFEFLRPVYAGEKILCVGLVEEVRAEPKRWAVSFTFEAENERGKVVLRGTAVGVILRPDAA